MVKVSVGIFLAMLGLIAALALQDPLAGANLTAAQRAAGYQSLDLVVNGEDCRFCRIRIERTLADVPGVKVVKVKMSRHLARVVYDPRVVERAALLAAVAGPESSGSEGSSAKPQAPL